MTRDGLIWRAILVVIAAGMVFMAGHEVGTHEADRRCEDLIAAASPFAPPKLTPVTRFALIEGFTLNCVFDKEGEGGDIVLWDGDVPEAGSKPAKTCQAIEGRSVIGELQKSTSPDGIGTVRLYQRVEANRDTGQP